MTCCSRPDHAAIKRRFRYQRRVYRACMQKTRSCTTPQTLQSTGFKSVLFGDHSLSRGPDQKYHGVKSVVRWRVAKLQDFTRYSTIIRLFYSMTYGETKEEAALGDVATTSFCPAVRSHPASRPRSYYCSSRRDDFAARKPPAQVLVVRLFSVLMPVSSCLENTLAECGSHLPLHIRQSVQATASTFIFICVEEFER